jgi:hypothetical protein
MVCRAETESAVQSISTRQFGLITHPQLIGAGLTGTMVKNRQESRRLLPAGRAVYAVGRRAEGRLAAGMAATMVAGGGPCFPVEPQPTSGESTDIAAITK